MLHHTAVFFSPLSPPPCCYNPNLDYMNEGSQDHPPPLLDPSILSICLSLPFWLSVVVSCFPTFHLSLPAPFLPNYHLVLLLSRFIFLLFGTAMIQIFSPIFFPLQTQTSTPSLSHVPLALSLCSALPLFWTALVETSPAVLWFPCRWEDGIFVSVIKSLYFYSRLKAASSMHPLTVGDA